jgi:hypothetical protein
LAVFTVDEISKVLGKFHKTQSTAINGKLIQSKIPAKMFNVHDRLMNTKSRWIPAASTPPHCIVMQSSKQKHEKYQMHLNKHFSSKAFFLAMEAKIQIYAISIRDQFCYRKA